MKKIISVSVLCLAVLTVFTACLSGGKAKATLIERPERIFWEIKGAKGSVYLLGTIHIANESFYPIETGIVDAFTRSKTIYAELSPKDLEGIVVELYNQVQQSVVFDPNKKISAHLTPHE